MSKRSGRRKKPRHDSVLEREPKEHEIDLNQWAVVAHAADREEADFFRRLIGEHDIEVLFSDDVDGYEPEEGEEGIAILVPEEEMDTAYHLIKDHEEYAASGGLMAADDEQEDEEDDEETGVPHAGGYGGYEEFDPLEHHDDQDADDSGLGIDLDDDSPSYFDDDEH